MSILKDVQEKLLMGDKIVLDNEQYNLMLEEVKQDLFKFVPPGHFYSPLPDLQNIAVEKSNIWKENKNIPGVDMNESVQSEHLDYFFELADSIPFEDYKKGNLRYGYINPAYSYADAITLHCMMRKYRPKKIIEVGSGQSSCVMLDTNEFFLNNSAAITFIEPYPEYFFSLISQQDKDRNKIISSKLQDVPLSVFENLEDKDILFIDSSHVSKVNSDVNRIFFEILPKLKKGVIVHFHDIFYPFEYPFEWVMEGRAWNEIYLLRSFMQYNISFEILFMSSYAGTRFADKIQQFLPQFLKNTGGNFWIRKN